MFSCLRSSLGARLCFPRLWALVFFLLKSRLGVLVFEFFVSGAISMSKHWGPKARFQKNKQEGPEA